jgi:prolipoprotein diacylglyceryl transferase
VLAQGLGRWGNWFNQELYGRPTHFPWAVRIDYNHQSGIIANKYIEQPYGYFQPTFLYESIWDIATAVILVLLDRRYKLGHGRVFAAYLIIYGLGRSWIEALRIDPAHHFFGLRLNDWTSILIVVAGVVGFVVSSRRHPGRETTFLRDSTTSDGAAAGLGDVAPAPGESVDEPFGLDADTAPDAVGDTADVGPPGTRGEAGDP